MMKETGEKGVLNFLLGCYNQTRDEKILDQIVQLTPKNQPTDKLFYKGLTFYFTEYTADNSRLYASLDELFPLYIITAPCDYDGVLIATIDESLRENEHDDLIRYFDPITGAEK